MTLFFKNWLDVLQTASVVNRQVLIVRSIQRHYNIDVCSGMSKAEKRMNHNDHWHTDSERQPVEEYIARHKDEYLLSLLEDHRRKTPCSCSDPRMERERMLTG